MAAGEVKMSGGRKTGEPDAREEKNVDLPRSDAPPLSSKLSGKVAIASTVVLYVQLPNP